MVDSLKRWANLEEWRPVKGFEDRYQVSSFGRVRSLPMAVQTRSPDKTATRIIKGRVLRFSVPAHGYRMVKLFRACKGVWRAVHRLVCEAFNGAPMPGQQCLHRDDVRHHNFPHNLRWGTPAENFQDALRNGRVLVGERSPHSRLKEPQVREIRSRAEEGDTYKRLSQEFGVYPSTVKRIHQRLAWKHVQ